MAGTRSAIHRPCRAIETSDGESAETPPNHQVARGVAATKLDGAAASHKRESPEFGDAQIARRWPTGPLGDHGRGTGYYSKRPE